MPLTLDEIVEVTSQLPNDTFDELMDRIVQARFGPRDSDVQAAWDKEIARRIEEIDSGKEVGIPAEEVFAKARSLFKK